MSIDISFYPQKTPKNELKEFIESFNVTRCEHLWDWPKGTLNYHWFERDKFKSADGVEITLSQKNNHWYIHTRTRASASWFDVEMQNRILKNAKKKFKGVIKGDYGQNRYAPLWNDSSTPVSRGLSAIYEEVFSRIERIEHALPNAMMNHQANKPEDQKLVDFMNSVDPTRAIYNGLVPFAISAFEFYFSQTFQILLECDESLQNKIENYNKKIEFKDLVLVSKKEKTIASIIADEYSFQSIDKINKAYLEWFKLDVKNLLYKKKKIGKKFYLLEKKIREIIDFRHGIVHHFAFDSQFDRKQLLEMFEAIKIIVNIMTDAIEKKHAIQIDGFRRKFKNGRKSIVKARPS